MKRLLVPFSGVAAFLLVLLLLAWAGVFSAGRPVHTGPAPAASGTPLAVAYFPRIARNITEPPSPTPLLPDLWGSGGIGGGAICFTDTFPLYTVLHVQNSGPVPAGPFVVRGSGWRDWSWDWSLPGLVAWGEVYTQTDYVLGTVEVDADHQVVESNEDNNWIWIATVTPPPRCTDGPTPTPSLTPPCKGTPGCGPTVPPTVPCRAGPACGPSTTPTPSPLFP